MPKYNKIFGLSLLATAILLSACQPREKEAKEVTPPETVQTQPEIAQLKGQTEKLNLDIPECDGKNCPEISIERLNSNQAFIDQFIDQQILARLQGVLNADAIAPAKVEVASEPEADETPASDAAPKPQLSARQKLEKQSQPYMQTFLNLDKELKDLSANHSISLMIKPKILNPGAPLATVVLNSTHYLGGAHGSTAQNYYNFDLDRKKLVKLDDIILPNKKAQLEAKAHEVFKTWVIDSQLATDIKEYEQAWKFKLTDNFFLTRDGLALQYAEYEIGPYVVGLPRLNIPFSELEGIIKPEYLPKSEQAAASEAKANAK
ncbi:RsiV family protein [Acinetobacter thermotolerans]|uniref:RsiV family protein n=1 Tax=Acinetobacter thermotolerans TaxID=3151487 RepID=UPI00325AFCA2